MDDLGVIHGRFQVLHNDHLVIIAAALWAEQWGHWVRGVGGGGGGEVVQPSPDEEDDHHSYWRCTSGKLLSPSLPRALAVLAVPTVVACQWTFYQMLNRDTSWAAFAHFILFDGGVTILGMVVVLLGPVGRADGLEEVGQPWRTAAGGRQEALEASAGRGPG